MVETTSSSLLINQKGVHRRLSDGKYRLIAPWIEYTARVDVEDTISKLDTLSFRSDDLTVQELTLVPADFHAFGKWRSSLLNAGYTLPRDREEAVMIHEHLLQMPPKERRHVVHKVGWHGHAFVLPGMPAMDKDIIVVFQEAQAGRVGNFGVGGTLEGWRAHVAKPAAASSRLVFAIGLAFAAPLLRFTSFDSCGAHLVGSSSIGKTTVLLVATSVSGRPDRRELLTWDVTKAGLSETAMGHNDCLMCIDELANAEGNSAAMARRMREMAYMLASGGGRIRSSVYGLTVNIKDARWRLLYLSSGEYGIADLANEAAAARMKGEQVRLIDVPATASPELGIYDYLPEGFDSPAALSEALEAACRQHYGVPLRAFVSKVAADAEAMPGRVNDLVATFMKKAGVSDDGWERRFARPFALSYAGAMLAARAGILPWTPTIIAKAISTCYVAARLYVPDADKLRAEGVAMLREILGRPGAVLALRRRGNKVLWKPEEARAAAAFVKDTPASERNFLISGDKLEECLGKVRARAVLEWLGAAGYLIRDAHTGEFTRQVQIHGLEQRHRYYSVKFGALEGEA